MIARQVRRIPKLGAFLLVLGMAEMVVGCSLMPVRTIHDECVIDRPVRLTHDEFLALSDESAKQIRQHNETGAKVCGWPHK